MRQLKRMAAVVAACGPLALSLLAGPIFPTAAGAQSGSSKRDWLQIEFSRGFMSALRRNGVRIDGIRPARLRGRLATFPATGGSVQLQGLGGTGAYAGGIIFRSRGRRVALRELAINAEIERPRISAGFSWGARQFIARIGPTESRREGFGVRIRIANLTFARPVERLIPPRLRVRAPFTEGRSLGSAVAVSRPRQAQVRSGTIFLALDGNLFAKLRSLAVSAAPIEPAVLSATEPPAFAFPIFGGALAPDGSSGIVGTDQGVRLVRGQPPAQTTMSISNLTVSPDSGEATGHIAVAPPPPDGGLYGIAQIATVDPGPSTTVAAPRVRKISVSGLPAAINAFLAEKLDQTFAAPQGRAGLFRAGEPLGVFAIDAQAE